MKTKQFGAVLAAFCLVAAIPAIAEDENSSEHLKIENGNVFERLQDKPWKQVGSATLATAVKALGDLYPDTTFAMDPKLASVPLSDLKVRSSEAQSDLEALRAACGEQFDVDDHQGTSLFSLKANFEFQTTSMANSNPREIQVFSLAGYLDQQSKDTDKTKAVDQLQQLINQTIGDFDGTIPQPKIRFHEDGKLLVVIGTTQAIDVAGKVINALPGQQNSWFSYGGMTGTAGGGNALLGGFGGGGSYSVGLAGANPVATYGRGIRSGNVQSTRSIPASNQNAADPTAAPNPAAQAGTTTLQVK